MASIQNINRGNRDFPPKIMKKPTKQIITIDSESDIDSNSSNSPMQPQQTPVDNKIKTPPQDMYQKFTSSTFYMLTESLKKYANQVNDFLELRRNVLFVFGPSGCGKGSLVKKVLEYNGISYDEIEEYEDENDRMVSLGDAILETLKKINSQRVHICYDFPISVQKCTFNQIRQFKTEFSQQIKRTTTKIIFILNEQIYNSFYVLNERGSSQSNISNRDNVSVIKMEKFGVFQLRRILRGFVDCEKLHNYVSLTKDFLEEIIQLAGGDLRKALHLMYWRGVEDKSDKILKEEKRRVEMQRGQKKIFVKEEKQFGKKTQNNIQKQQINIPKHHSSSIPNNEQLSNTLSLFALSSPISKPAVSKYESFLKHKSLSQSRVSLYHGLGKLLYGKRLNIKHSAKNKKQVSCYYTEKEINELDPPFYFDPVGLYQQLRIDFDIATNLLQQNYIQRYGKVKDIAKMSNIFRMLDCLFSYRNITQDESVKTIKIVLLTWGILIYNKNSRTDNMGFRKIEKSESSNVDRKVREKQRLLRHYFPQSRLSDLLSYAHLTRNIQPTSILNETLFNKAISRQQTIRFDDHTKTFNEQEEEQMETMLKLTANQLQKKLRQAIRQDKKKKKQMDEIMIDLEEEDESIDQISESDEEEL